MFFNNTAIEPSNTYAYDALYRLIRAEGREHAAQNNLQRDAKNFEPVIGIPFPNSPEALQRYIEDYEYDPVGNILGLHHTGGGAERWVRRYQYALDSNRLLATRLPGEASNLPDYTAAPGYGAKYTYDEHGNMTSMPHLPAMEWDFKNQLHATQRQVVNGGIGEKTYYVYDAGGQRVRKVTETQNGNPKDERIYLAGFEVFRKYNGNGQTVTLERETLHIMDDKQRIALIETRTRLAGADPAPRQLVRYQLGNNLGSAALELDDQAQVISYEEYHPYGTTAYEAARTETETSKRYRYTGKERDEETGFSYHEARYYAPWLGRWSSSDPLGIADGVNTYCFVNGHPIGSFDVNGMQEEKKYPLDEPGDAGAPLTAPQPDYVNQGGEPIYNMTDEQRKEQKAELPEGGAAPPAEARKGIVPTTGGAAVKKYIRQEVVTGQKAALRNNPLTGSAVLLATMVTLPFSEKRAERIANLVIGPEPRSEIAQGSEMYTTLTLGVVETFLFAGAEAASRGFKLNMPVVGSRRGSVGSAALNDPAFNSDALSVSDAQATLKSVRQHTERLASGKVVSNDSSVRDLTTRVQSARATGDRTSTGTAMHDLKFAFTRDLEGRGLLTNRRLDTPGQIADYRVPDFQLVDPSYSPPRPMAIWDFKVKNLNEYSHWGSDQFTDIRNATGIRTVPLYYKMPPIR